MTTNVQANRTDSEAAAPVLKELLDSSLATADDLVELRWEPLVAALRDERTGNDNVEALFRVASPGDRLRRAPSRGRRLQNASANRD